MANPESMPKKLLELNVRVDDAAGPELEAVFSAVVVREELSRFVCVSCVVGVASDVCLVCASEALGLAEVEPPEPRVGSSESELVKVVISAAGRVVVFIATPLFVYAQRQYGACVRLNDGFPNCALVYETRKSCALSVFVAAKVVNGTGVPLSHVIGFPTGSGCRPPCCGPSRRQHIKSSILIGPPS